MTAKISDVLSQNTERKREKSNNLRNLSSKNKNINKMNSVFLLFINFLLPYCVCILVFCILSTAHIADFCW